MSSISTYQQHNQAITNPIHKTWLPRHVGIIILISAAIKLMLIGFNQGEYTDGIIQIQVWQSPVVFFPPGYSALVALCNLFIDDLVLCGRLVSILASLGSLWIFYALAKPFEKGNNEAFWAVLFLALSPIFNRWSLRVMTDSLFCFLFLVCCYSLLADPKRCPKRLLCWAGLASLVRYQGFFFIPFVLYLIWKKGMGRLTMKNTLSWFISLLPWFALIAWIAWRGFGHYGQFAERASMGFGMTALLYYAWFEGFILYWPWAVTYGLFVAGIIGMTDYAKPSNHSQFAFNFTVIAIVIFLIVQSAFLSFQYRYFLPLVPLWCLLAARGWMVLLSRLQQQWSQMLAGTLIIGNLLILSAGVVVLQRAAFGDLAASAKALQTVGKGSRVLSDEIYREGVYNVKMEYWSGRELELYHYIEPTQSYVIKPQAGDYVVLHNTYSDLEAEQKRLSNRFDIQVLGRWTYHPQEGGYVTIPLLPDIMVTPRKPPQTSNPSCMAFRFLPQRYYSVLLRLDKKESSS